MATFLGDPGSEDYIKKQINRIWIQSGIRIVWLPVTDYVNDFCFDGSPGNYYNGAARPADDHLIRIVDFDGASAKHPDGEVANLFFVRISPGTTSLPPNVAAGLSFLDSNGGAVYVGEDLLTSEPGRDAVASLISHELGHNLGLDHAAGNVNLMSVGGQTEQLSPSQTAVVFTNDEGYEGVDGWDMLQVLPGQPEFTAWSLHNASELKTHADDDKDGVINVLEYMFGYDVLVPDSQQFPAPVLSEDGLTWTFSKQGPAVDDGLAYEIEVSSDGKTWDDAGTPGSGSTVLVNNGSTLSARLDSGAQHGIMRFKAGIPENFLAPVAAGSTSLVLPSTEEESTTGRRVCSKPECCFREVKVGLRSLLED
ncbi:MAG: hypothetical protein AAGJ79_12255 [Verrucomicrobiota bacterium]